MEEKNYYSDGSISVTSTRVMIGSATYSLRNISSVRTTFTTPNHALEVILIVIAIISLITGLGMIKDSGGFCIGLGVLLGGAGFFIYNSKKKEYIVLLGTNAGEQRALVSPNREYIDSIVGAINNAIIDYK